MASQFVIRPSRTNVLVYIGIVTILHIIFAGVVLNPASASTWVWLLAWPILLVFKAIYWSFLLVCVVAVIVVMGFVRAKPIRETHN